MLSKHRRSPLALPPLPTASKRHTLDATIHSDLAAIWVLGQHSITAARRARCYGGSCALLRVGHTSLEVVTCCSSQSISKGEPTRPYSGLLAGRLAFLLLSRLVGIGGAPALVRANAAVECAGRQTADCRSGRCGHARGSVAGSLVQCGSMLVRGWASGSLELRDQLTWPP